MKNLRYSYFDLQIKCPSKGNNIFVSSEFSCSKHTMRHTKKDKYKLASKQQSPHQPPASSFHDLHVPTFHDILTSLPARMKAILPSQAPARGPDPDFGDPGIPGFHPCLKAFLFFWEKRPFWNQTKTSVTIIVHQDWFGILQIQHRIL